jgi:hypothetical protein
VVQDLNNQPKSNGKFLTLFILDLIFFLFQVAKSNEHLALLLSFEKISGINNLDCWKANPLTPTKYSQVGRKSGLA